MRKKRTIDYIQGEIRDDTREKVKNTHYTQKNSKSFDKKTLMIDSKTVKLIDKDISKKEIKHKKNLSRIKTIFKKNKLMIFFFNFFLLFIKPITPLVASETDVYLPEEYDVRETYNCKSFDVIRDQGHCGACWACATAEVISDLLCIKSGGKKQTIISDTYLLTNCQYCFNHTSEKKGCVGGIREYAFLFWILSGLPSGGLNGDKTSCFPYPFNSTEEVDVEKVRKKLKFREKCDNIGASRAKLYGSGYRVLDNDETQIMKELYYNGPVTASFEVYNDFDSFPHENSSKIYEHDLESPKKDYHAIKIIGWGNEIINGEKKPYWLCVNSWGKSWGINGTFKFRRGTNECKIESFVISGYINSERLEAFNSEQSVITFENHFFSFKNVDRDFR